MFKYFCLGLFFYAAASPGADEALWDIGLGVSAAHIPHYIGADEGENYVLPFPYIVYRGEKLKIDRNFVHGEIFTRGNWRAEWSLSGSPPVDSDDNRAREGMPDIDAIGEAGPSLMYTLSSSENSLWRVELPVRKAVSTDWHSVDDRGWISNPLLRVNYRWQNVQSRWLFEGTLGPVYANERYNDYFYDVDARYQTAERATYDAEGGRSGWRMSLGISRRQQQWWWGAFIRYMNIDDAVFAESPLVKQHESWLVGVAFAWIWRSSKQTSDEWSCQQGESSTVVC